MDIRHLSLLFLLFLSSCLSTSQLWLITPHGDSMDWYVTSRGDCDFSKQFSLEPPDLKDDNWNVTGAVTSEDKDHMMVWYTYSNGSSASTVVGYVNLDKQGRNTDWAVPVDNLIPRNIVWNQGTDDSAWVFASVTSDSSVAHAGNINSDGKMDNDFFFPLLAKDVTQWSASVDDTGHQGFVLTWTPSIRIVQTLDLRALKIQHATSVQVPSSNQNDVLVSSWFCCDDKIWAIFRSYDSSDRKYHFSLARVHSGEGTIDYENRNFASSQFYSDDDAVSNSHAQYNSVNVYVQYLSGPETIYYFDDNGKIIHSEDCKLDYANYRISYHG